MIWIVPIGGKGARTQILGEFKPFIKIRGHKMLSWLICSVKNNVNLKDRFIFTTTEYFANKFNVEKEIEEIFKTHKLENRFTLFTSKEMLPGPSPSIYLAKKLLQTKESVVVLNCDQYVDFQLPKEIPPKTCLIAVRAEFGNLSGYVKIKICNFRRRCSGLCFRKTVC